MPSYPFHLLSGHDFEHVVRDILQERWGIELEEFGSGPDGGVDLRRAGVVNPNELVVQCKQYSGSDARALQRVLKRDELPKIRALNPARYVVVTSLPLSRAAKDRIRSDMSPFVRRTSDIINRQDLDNWLARLPQVEERHPKLWMTSANVLGRILSSHIFEQGTAEIARVRRLIQRYVPGPHFEQARRLLEDQHFCLLAGKPGAGKTTLARLLLMHYAESRNFEVVPISADVAEIARAKRRGRKQVFYFDDFLGQTGLAQFARNEDRRLVELIEDVVAEPSWRMIVTTREYVLEAAQQRSEALGALPLQIRTCTVAPQAYQPIVRAEILYNHLFYSDLPKEYVLAVIANGSYRRIIGHPNYNPRILEHMTTAAYVGDVRADHYADEFIAALNDPRRIWEKPFHEHISDDARDLLLVMATMRSEVLVEDLGAAWSAFQRLRSVEYNRPRTTPGIERTMKPLIGTFLTTSPVGNKVVVRFDNPSVRDFLEHHLSRSPQAVTDLVAGAEYFDQLTTLQRGRKGTPYPGLVLRLDVLASAALRTADRHLTRVSSERLSPWFHAPSLADDVLSIIEIADRNPSNELVDAIRILGSRLVRSWIDAEDEGNRVDPQGVVQLLSHVFATKASPRGTATLESQGAGSLALGQQVVFDAGVSVLLSQLEDPDDFAALSLLVERVPDALDAAAKRRARQAFCRYCESESWISISPESSGFWTDRIRELSEQAAVFGIDPEREPLITAAFRRMAERAEQLQTEEEDEQRKHERAGHGGGPMLPARAATIAPISRASGPADSERIERLFTRLSGIVASRVARR